LNSNHTQSKHRHSLRLKGYDYSSEGAYFITICINNRECLLGKIVRVDTKFSADTGVCPCTEIVLSNAGQMITDIWHQIPAYYANIDIDEFVVMPNHLHGIVIINKDNSIKDTNPLKMFRLGQTQGSAPTNLSLPDIVNRFKTMTTRIYIDGVENRGWKAFNKKLWQRNYFEHIIRDDDDLNRIREYIQFNPVDWESDEEFIQEK
jgi:putative transposase